MTTLEAAFQLEIGESTVRAHVKAGRIRAYRIGGRWVIYQADLDAFLAECLYSPSAPERRTKSKPIPAVKPSAPAASRWFAEHELPVSLRRKDGRDG